MKNKYIDLIEQTFEFPQDEFKVIDNELYWNDISLMDIIKQYGTPLKINFLPSISKQIQKARRLFNVAMAKVDYQAEYYYAYCTKSSHFSYILDEVIKNDCFLETSSAFDLNIVETLIENKSIDKDITIICNGFKRPQYIENINKFVNDGFKNIIIVFDNKKESTEYQFEEGKCAKIGIRIASEEEPMFDFYTSRLGVRYNDIIPFYMQAIKGNPAFELKMLHFFINTGIKDTAYYWNELSKCVNVYVELKKVCPTLDSLNIGGGFPVQNSLAFDYDYEYMAEEIIAQVKNVCTLHDVPEPNI
jgi:arginine decarboxylase